MAIDAWLDAAANLRNPVVFQAYSRDKTTKKWFKVEQQGFLFHDEKISSKWRVFVVDLTKVA